MRGFGPWKGSDVTAIDADWLRQIPLFTLLDSRERADLLAHADITEHAAHSVIFSAGEDGGVMYVIERGRIEIYLRDAAHEHLTVAEMGAGEIFGELSLLDNMPRSASARALEDTTLIAFTREDLLQLVTAHPSAALDMMTMLGQRVRDTSTLAQSRVTARNPNTEIEEQEQRSFGARIAEWLTALAGDVRFVYVTTIFFIFWFAVNLDLVPGVPAFDPFPFGLLTMILSVEAIYLTMFLLISQNREAARDRIRNDIEYQVNLQAEKEIRELHDRMEEVEAMLVKLLSRTAPTQPND